MHLVRRLVFRTGPARLAQGLEEGVEGDQRQQAEHGHEQRADLLRGGEVAESVQHGSHLPQGDPRAPGAVEEGAPLLRPRPVRMGAPKVTEHRMGTGTTSPLGITRWTLWIQAGTSTTCGNICASR